MAELPEISKLAGQMRDTLCGKTIKTVTLLQEKCANISPEEYQKRVASARIKDVRNKGKWIITSLSIKTGSTTSYICPACQKE
ncbi:MAG: hypothetical protein GXX04_01265 [Clostridiaceae bacterium]|nr:hypothetical protein [Clostridiaceae bacterium]